MTKTTKASSGKPPAKPAKTTIKKSKGSEEKNEAKKTAATTNKATPVKKRAVPAKVAPKVTDPANSANATKGNSDILELCLLLDCTGSMGSWIQRSKDTLKQIIEQVKKENEALTVRVCFIGYRDV